MLVFVQSIERAKELFHELIYDGLNVDVIHSERTQAQRDNVVKCFRSGKVQYVMLFPVDRYFYLVFHVTMRHERLHESDLRQLLWR